MNLENWTMFDEVTAFSFSMGQAVAASSFAVVIYVSVDVTVHLLSLALWSQLCGFDL